MAALIHRFTVMPLRGFAVAAAAAVTIGGASGGARAASTPLEHAVKANYLYKFAPFVTWPTDAFAPGNPFTICLIGQNGFATMLDEAVRGQMIDERPIAIKRIATAAALPPCHILFIGRATQPASEILRAAAAYPILTVTDPNYGSGSGMIDFQIRGGRVRFTIDMTAAHASRLQISSKLLGLALSVNGR